MLLKSCSNIFLAFVAISFYSVYGKSMLNVDLTEDTDPGGWVIVNGTFFNVTNVNVTKVNQTNANETYVDETNTNETEIWQKTEPPTAAPTQPANMNVTEIWQKTEPPTAAPTKPAKRKVLSCGKRHINQNLGRQRAKIVGGQQAVKGAYPWQV